MNKISSRMLAFASAAMLFAGSSALAQSTWTGLGSDSNWSTLDNWDVNPTFPTTLTFAGTTQLAPNNDLTSGLFGVVVGTNGGTAMTFDAAAGEFTLGGNAITLAGHVGFNGDPATVVTQAITMPLFLNRTVGFNTQSNGVLSVNGGISALGAYGVWHNGDGRMILGAGNTFGGGVYSYGGTLQFAASEAINSSPGTLGAAANVTSRPAIVDLAGTTQTLSTFSLGNQSPGTSGLENQAIDSVGGGLLRMASVSSANVYTFAGGAGSSNGMATISCPVSFANNLYLERNPSLAVDLLISGPITNSLANGIFFYGRNGTNNPAVVKITSTNNTFTTALNIRDSITLILGANDTMPTATPQALQMVSITGGKPVLDLYGTTNTCAGLTLSAGGGSVAGSESSVVDTVGGGVLKLGGSVNYNSGPAAYQHGTATISATLDLNGANRGFNINDSTNAAVDVLITGAIIDSVGTNGINKNNKGVLVLAATNTYNGNTTVNAGTLQLNVASLNPAAAVNINNVGTTDLPLLSLNFVGTNIVSAFNTNGVALPDGVYNAANMPGVISGPGALQVGAVVSPPTPALLTNSVSGSTLTLTWPSGQNWRLVSQTNGLATGLNPDTNAWFDVPGGIDGSNSIAVDPANPTVFYRLVWP